MSTISAFPITAKKATELSTASTLSSANSIVVYTTDLKTITFSQFLALLSFQTQHANLTAISALPSLTDLGENLLVQDPPSTLTSYLLSSILGVPIFKTPTQVVADLVANGGGVDTTTAQALLGKSINGLNFAVGTAPTPDASITDIDTPSDSYLLRLIKVNYSGGVINFRFTGSTDLTFPKTGVLATVAGVRDQSDDTKASAATVNLNTVDGSQVDITGTTTITAITLAENVEKVVRFTGVTTLVYSSNLQLPSGGEDIVVGVGDYAVFKGLAGSAVRCVEYHRANGAMVADIDFATITNSNFASSTIQGDNTDIVGEISLLDSGTGRRLRIVHLEAATGDRSLNISVNDANRQLNLAGDLNITGEVKIYSGTGTPEANVTATVGSLYTRTDGGANTTLYVKESGSGNTGWIAK